ncbi:hypothetical protein GCM10009104_23810 [Marinobacterium maritimum]|uniref:Competence protein CoiA-like N-terminal domain-containing protein n=1 Tax=Marinobacterium maritimum TaxID=500162 RepID=A0ABP3TCS6_9GAMM
MKTPIGIDANTGEIRLIDDVESGLKCNCVCPECGSPLIAKKGPIKADHFSHYKATEQQACRETAVHLMAKHVLSNATTILFPTYRCQSKEVYSYLREPFGSAREFFLEPLEVSNGREEVYLSEHQIKPDVMCSTVVEGLELEVAIEVAVTHEVDEDKARKIAAADLTSFEIDLSDLTNAPQLTFKDIEQALSEKARLSWLSESVVLRQHLNGICHARSVDERDKRNHELSIWLDGVRNHFKTIGAITLPRYLLPRILTQEDRDWTGKPIRLRIPVMPNLPTELQVRDVADLDKAILTMMCSDGIHQFRLHISIQLPGARPRILKETHLKVDTEELPEPTTLEQHLAWGKSTTMDKYISTVRSARQHALKEANDKIRNDLQQRIEWFNDIRSGAQQPVFVNLERIQRDYNQALLELVNKGIPVHQWTKNYREGWIFGCPNEYWQILLIRMICSVNNDGVNVKYYASELRKRHGIDAIEPVRTLTFQKDVLYRLNFDPELVPSTFKILWDFFQHLEQHNVLKKSGRGQFTKLIPYGHAYRAL